MTAPGPLKQARPMRQHPTHEGLGTLWRSGPDRGLPFPPKEGAAASGMNRQIAKERIG